MNRSTYFYVLMGINLSLMFVELCLFGFFLGNGDHWMALVQFVSGVCFAGAARINHVLAGRSTGSEK